MFLKMALSPVTPCRRKRADRGPGSAHAVRIDEGTDAEICVLAFRRSAARTAAFAVFSVVLCLLPLLVTRWKPFWRLVLTHRPCSLRDATSLYVKCGHGGQTSGTVVPVVCEVAGSGVSAEFLVTPSDTSSMSSDSDLPLVAANNQQLQMRFFWFYRLKYTWSADRDCFVQLSGLDRGVSVQQLLENYPGYSLERQRARLSLFGENRLYIEVKSYCQLLVAEALNPFYIFQLWSIILWSCDEYYIYAACILFISVVSIAISLYEIRRQSKVLRDMVVASAVSTVTVRRNTGAMEQVDTDDLVPGDVLVLPSTGYCMPCDAALITGSCIVNESMLTGESVPVTKTSLAVSEDSEIYSPEHHKRSTLFCGTQVIQSRCHREGPVLAVVIRTAFNTAKGELIRSILFPKPMGFKFYRDSIKFVGFLALMASGGMAYTVYLYLIRGASVRDIILRSLDIITVVVPPALPAAMTVGTVYAQNRLKRANIFCISPPRINVCGKLKLFCFDKTGTLTEEGLSTWGVVGCSPATGLAPPTRDVSQLSDQSALKIALASCHSLTRLAGQLIGDPLDVKMFESTGWELEEPSVGDSPRGELLAPTVVHPASSCSVTAASSPMTDSSVGGPPAAAGELQPPEVGIVRQFPFVSEAQRMSVVARCRGRAGLHLYCKGAPEKIEQLCTSVPADFHEVLHEYTVQGYRVLAVAHRPLDDIIQGRGVQRLKRDQVECDLELCGLLIMQNRLKPETRPVIETLQRADVRCVMVTGDNLLTAVSVGRGCGLIPAGASAVIVEASPPSSLSPARLLFSLAAAGDSIPGQQLQPPPVYKNGSQVHILLSEEQSVPSVALENYQLVTTGRSWRVLQQYFPDVIDKLVVRATIFARMSPDQKAQVVEALQHVGYTVGMCGDGANDCEALRTAHAGISLSEAEASVAAPFTSKTADISCVPTLIREGRAALATSFSTFKYMALYSMIQFVSVLLLYERYSNLSDMQFLYVDLVITTTVAVTMGYTAAAPTLHRRPPPGSLLGPANLISIVAQVGMVGACQVIGLWLLEAQSWYVPVTSSHDEGTLLCWENTVIFCISSYQYLILATAFSRGPPYRRALYTNPLFLVSLLILTGLQTTLVLVPYPPLADFFGLVSADTGHVSWPMRRAVIIICAVHFLLALSVEFVVSKSGWVKQLMRCCGLKRPPKNRYHLIEQELRDSCWPPIDRPLLARPLSVNSSDGGR